MPSPKRSFRVDELAVHVFEDQPSMAAAVVDEVHDFVVRTIADQRSFAAILATGNSQIAFLKQLSERGGIDWSLATLFHMDEYLGIAADHPASFRRYLRERVEVPMKPGAFHYLHGDCDVPNAECRRYAGLLSAQPIDLCCLGVGENGHLAFNDPHVADFQDPDAVKLVRLDDACKTQQVKEGHFPALDAVPPYAFTLTIPTLCRARKVVCVAPESRKADAVKAALEGPVSETCPTSHLRTQPHAVLFLDEDSARGLNA